MDELKSEFLQKIEEIKKALMKRGRYNNKEKKRRLQNLYKFNKKIIKKLDKTKKIVYNKKKRKGKR